ncbi:hypothetical protein [Saccharopolyspora hordei]|uniref:Uncharacterized protein n=1 Tax=Saccharopolyspora hordei TaxID=1838 RepID=A0A853AFW0_9PSEU|nr:hypothetical protein [Saccharopolyspora hordei]NYI83035.1 hypothetical protein [Saccharopolyspora hordei]
MVAFQELDVAGRVVRRVLLGPGAPLEEVEHVLVFACGGRGGRGRDVEHGNLPVTAGLVTLGEWLIMCWS